MSEELTEDPALFGAMGLVGFAEGVVTDANGNVINNTPEQENLVDQEKTQ